MRRRITVQRIAYLAAKSGADRCATGGFPRLSSSWRLLALAVLTVGAAGTQLNHAGEAAAEVLQQAGLRELRGKHISIVTDIAAADEVDELPAVFDAAVVEWAKYFGVAAERLEPFQPTAYLMSDKNVFRQAGLFPDDLPPFPTGYQQQGRIWLYQQPAAYYQRHLLLHEGVHAFTQQFFGGSGPPWYTEGIAEFLALHRWSNGHIEIGINPLASEEVPFWGRMKLIQQARDMGTSLTLPEVMRFGPDAHRRVEPYAWSWAAIFFFENHPDYRDAFRACRAELADSSPTFSERLIARLGDRWGQVQLNWSVFVHECDFGYDLARAALVFSPNRTGNFDEATVTVAADRGWHVTGIHVEQARPYQFVATGRYQLALQPKPWWCEPQGVTIHYYRGKPLGALLAAVVPDDDPTRMTAPALVGAQRTWQPPRTGVLCLKINDSPSLLRDNSGTLTVSIRP